MNIPCPACSAQASRVLDSRVISTDVDQLQGSIRRRRQCVCGARFTTIEIYKERIKELHALPVEEPPYYGA